MSERKKLGENSIKVEPLTYDEAYEAYEKAFTAFLKVAEQCAKELDVADVLTTDDGFNCDSVDVDVADTGAETIFREGAHIPDKTASNWAKQIRDDAERKLAIANVALMRPTANLRSAIARMFESPLRNYDRINNDAKHKNIIPSLNKSDLLRSKNKIIFNKSDLISKTFLSEPRLDAQEEILSLAKKMGITPENWLDAYGQALLNSQGVSQDQIGEFFMKLRYIFDGLEPFSWPDNYPKDYQPSLDSEFTHPENN